jgi:hypothetical protein
MKPQTRLFMRIFVGIAFGSVVPPSMAGTPPAESRASRDRNLLEVAAAIDREVDRSLAAEKVPASPLADDAEFLRRAYLDITGRIPSVENARAFLDSREPDKRRKLIEELLASPHYGEHFGNGWRNLIVPRDPYAVLQRPPDPSPFARWLADEFNQGRGWDQIVAAMLTAQGPGASTPQNIFLNYNANANGAPQAPDITRTISGLFLGVQLQCAECHKHPYDKWQQTDFWGIAAFFGRLGRSKREVLEGSRRRLLLMAMRKVSARRL